MACFQLLMILATSLGQLESPPTAQVIHDQVQSAHERLLRHPGGIKLDYKIAVQQEKDRPVFNWVNGLDGSLTILWPELVSVVEGDFSGEYEITPQGEPKLRPPKRRARKGYYNFSTGVSIGVDGEILGQVLRSRHAYSSVNCFPLVFQRYAESDQYFDGGTKYSDPYMLPHALLQQSGFVITNDVMNGISCIRVENPGFDVMWFARNQGFCLVKRQVCFGKGKPVKEEILNSDLREIAPGVWLPMLGYFTAYSHERRDPTYKLSLEVSRVSVGNIAKEAARLVLDEPIEEVENLITGQVFEPRDLAARLDEEIADFTLRTSRSRLSTRRFLAIANVAVVLSIAAYYVRKRSRSDSTSAMSSPSSATE